LKWFNFSREKTLYKSKQPAEPTDKGQVMVGDVTYPPLQNGWFYKKSVLRRASPGCREFG